MPRSANSSWLLGAEHRFNSFHSFRLQTGLAQYSILRKRATVSAAPSRMGLDIHRFAVFLAKSLKQSALKTHLPDLIESKKSDYTELGRIQA